MNNWKKTLTAILVFTVVIIFLIPVIVAPILDKRITAALNEKYPDYHFEIDNVKWGMISLKVKLNTLTISSKTQHSGTPDIYGEIGSIQFKGIKLLNAIFNNKYKIDEITISNSRLQGTIAFHPKKKQSKVSSINLQIGNILFDHINLSLKDSATSQTLSIKEGTLNLGDLEIEKLDTMGIFKRMDFNAEQLSTVSVDSMYTFKASGIAYSDSSKSLMVEGLNIMPNYKDYDFTEKYQHEIDRIEAVFSHITLSDFPVINYFKSGDLVSSSIAIGNMDLNVFRDKRKEDSQKKKPAFQEILYNYPGLLRIDSIELKNGNITYTEHAEKANDPGTMNINELKANIYNVTNDSIYKTKDTTLQMKTEALLMGKSKMTVSLEARLFDPQNTFSLNGTLDAMEVKELNSILEKNAFVYANSAKIDKMSFNFTANDSKATGQMIMLYNGLDLAIKNKRTDDTTAVKERFISFIANKRAWDSNPVPGDEARVGIIDYEREPTNFFFNYCMKSIVSGIKSSIIKTPAKKKTLRQNIFGKPKRNNPEAKKS